MMTFNKLSKIFFAIFLVVLAALYLNSSIWFKIKLADHYDKKGQEDNVISVYENIQRKLNVKSGNPLYLGYKLASDVEYKIIKKLAEYYKVKNKEKALIYYQMLIALAPQEEVNYYELLSIFQFLKVIDTRQIAKYAARYEKYFNSKIPLDFSGYKLWNYRLGCDLLKEGMRSRAVEELKIAVSLDPGFADAHFQLGQYYENSGKEDNAVQRYEETLKILPEHLEAMKSLYRIYTKRKLSERAEKIMKKVINLTPPEEMAVVLAGRIEVTGFKFTQLADKKIKLEFWFKCIDKVNYDYGFWFNGILKEWFKGEDINEKDYFDLGVDKKNQKWDIGEVFKQIYIVNLDPKHYNFKLGFWEYEQGQRIIYTKQVDLKNELLF